MCIVFLPNKTEAMYTYLLEKVLSLNSNLDPRSIMVDFEKAMMNSFSLYGSQRVFSSTLARIFTEKIQEVGLLQLYNSDANFLKMRMIASLAFYMPDKVTQAFEYLRNIYLKKQMTYLIILKILILGDQLKDTEDHQDLV